MKLPIASTIVDAFAFVWERRMWAINLALPAIVIIGILSVIAGNPDTEEAAGQPTEIKIVQVALFVFNVWFFVVYSVAWHRAYLTEEAQVTVLESYLWRMRHTMFAIQYIKILISLMVVGAILGTLIITLFPGGNITFVNGRLSVGSGSSSNAQIALLVMMVFIIWLMCRMLLVLPSVSLDGSSKLRDAWKMSKGNGWRIVGVVVFTFLITFLVSAVPALVATAVVLFTGAQETLSGSLAASLAAQFIGFMGIAVGVSALSISYRRIIDGQSLSQAD